MTSSIEHPQVEQTAVSHERGFIFLSKITIPGYCLDNVRPVLERVFALLQRDYRDIEYVKYHVTASYDMIHRKTGVRRRHSGDVLPEECNLSSIDTFYFLGPDFVNRLAPLCDTWSVIRKMVLSNGEKDWQFYSLTGLDISVQALVPHNFHVLIIKNLITRRQDHKRNLITYSLP